MTDCDQSGNQTSYKYNSLNEVIQETDPATTPGGTDPVTTYTYNPFGDVSSSTAPNGAVTNYQYDVMDRETGFTAPLGVSGGYTYNALGLMTSSTDALGNATTYGYNGLDELTSVVAPAPSAGAPSPTTSYTYDPNGNIKTVADALGDTTTYDYNHQGEESSVTDPNGHTTSFVYDPAGNLLSLTDPDGNTTSYQYDNLNQLVQDTNQLGYSDTYQYDPAGNLISQTDKDGRTSVYGYDNLGNLTSEKWLSSTGAVTETLNYAYDANSNLTSATDTSATGTVLSSVGYTNNAYGQALTEIESALNVPTVALSSSYNSLGERSSLSAQIGTQADFYNAYTYDLAGRMTQVSQSGQAASGTETGANAVAPKVVSLGYDANSNLTSIDRYSNTAATALVAQTAFTYDADQRLTNIAQTGPTGNAIDSFAYTYDQANRVHSLTTTPESGLALPTDGATTYGYDAAGELTSEQVTGGTGITYNYDANGNRTSVVTTPPGSGPGTTATYTTGTNDLLQSDGQNTYTYDHEGNLSTATNIATGAYTVYGYDYRNRLTSVTTYTNSSEANTTESVTYTYDALDRRIGEVATGTTNLNEHFAYDGDQIVLQFNGSGQLTDRYLDGPAVDMVLADEQYSSPSAAPTTAGSVQWPLTDMLGSVRDLVNSSGTVIDHLGYDAYGNMSQTAGNNSLTPTAVNYLFGYTGFIRDVATGQLLSMTRAYSSSDGNWRQEDPIGFVGGQANLGEFVGNRPVDGIDPTGLSRNAANQVLNLLEKGRYRDALNLLKDLGPAAREAVPEILAEIFRRYPANAIKCSVSAEIVSKVFRWVGESPTIIEITHPRGALVFFLEDGKTQWTISGDHEAVYCNGRVYDAITGKLGLPYADYIAKITALFGNGDVPVIKVIHGPPPPEMGQLPKP